MRGFTLIELLVSVTLFLLAVTVALAATIGANNLIVRAEARSSVAEAARTLSEQLRRLAALSKASDVTVTQSDLVVIKTFSPSQAGNVCTNIGLATHSYDPDSGTEEFNFGGSENKTVLAVKIFPLLENGFCGTEIVYQGRLAEATVETTQLEFVKSTPTGCGNDCALLRYRAVIREAGILQSESSQERRAVLDLTSSVALGVGQ